MEAIISKSEDCQYIYLREDFYDEILLTPGINTLTQISFEVSDICEDENPFTFAIVPEYSYCTEICIPVGDELLALSLFLSGVDYSIDAALDLYDPSDAADIILDFTATAPDVTDITIEYTGSEVKFCLISNTRHTDAELRGTDITSAKNIVLTQIACPITNVYADKVVVGGETWLRLNSHAVGQTDITGATEVITDGVYNIKGTASYESPISDSNSSKCVFIDCSIICSIAECLDDGEASENDMKVLALYDGVNFNTECSRCCTAREVYEALLAAIAGKDQCPC